MPVAKVEPYLRDIDLALCMTVFPGFGGQAYIPESTERIRAAAGADRPPQPGSASSRWTAASTRRPFRSRPVRGRTCSWRAPRSSAAKEGPAAAVKELAKLSEPGAQEPQVAYAPGSLDQYRNSNPRLNDCTQKSVRARLVAAGSSALLSRDLAQILERVACEEPRHTGERECQLAR